MSELLDLKTICDALTLYKGVQWRIYGSDNSVFVRTTQGVFILCDNGGEINVDKPNVWPMPVSIPLDYFGKPLNAHTMVYRILSVMQGDEIDYKHRVKVE